MSQPIYLCVTINTKVGVHTMSISENIKILKITKNMTQKELGDALHITDKNNK